MSPGLVRTLSPGSDMSRIDPNGGEIGVAETEELEVMSDASFVFRWYSWGGRMMS